MSDQVNENGVYHIPTMLGLLRGVTRELADAVPPLAPSAPPISWGSDSAAEPPAGAQSISSELTALLALLKEASSPAEEPAKSTLPSEGLSPDAPRGRYGWVAGALPTPDPEGRYVVEFVDKRAVRVLAYLDRYGRAFTTDSPLDSHPAREPDMKFARYAEQPDPHVLEGCVEIPGADGTWREVARFRRSNDRYTLYDSWYDFRGHGEELSYADALARSYLAFVYRPAHGAPEVPARGFDGVEAPLDAMPALPALRKVESDIVRAQWDPALHPPALARCLARWLGQANLEGLALSPSGALRLVKTVRYADIFYLAATEEGAGVSPRALWGLQNALNRYLLVKRALGDRASTARMAEVLQWDAHLIESLAVEAGAQVLTDLPVQEGEWGLRCRISQAVENLPAPLRFEVEWRADVQAGVVAFKALAPDADMMPMQRWDEAAQAVVDTTLGGRAGQARRYAQSIALFLAAVAFTGSAQVERVEFSAHTMREDQSFSLGDILAAEGSREPDDDDDRAFSLLLPGPEMYVAFEREAFLQGHPFAAGTDLARFFEDCGIQLADRAFERKGPSTEGPVFADGSGATLTFQDVSADKDTAFDLASADGLAEDPFRALSALPSAALRRDLPECVDAELPEWSRAALGAHWMHDLRIDVDAFHRRQAERLAARLAPAATATEAIKLVRRRQIGADDPFVEQACTRLMAALAEGEARPDDQNTVIRSYLGRDACQEALLRAQGMAAAGDVQGAGALLAQTAWAAEAKGRYVDDAEVVHRNFDNYPARILYNLVRTGTSGLAPEDATGFGEADRDRRVELVPDTLLRCHMEASKRLERSFSSVDDALSHAKRSVELAPTATMPRCLLARVYMLMGDMPSSSAALEEALTLATQPNEIAVAYYQLAYVRWKSGDARVGTACYVKSIATSPIMAAQAAVELQDLLNQESVKLPRRDEVDDVLRAGGIPVAPTDAVLDALTTAAEKAVDAGVFTVGRSLLAARLNYKPDDALMGVYRSLADVLV